MWANKLFRWQWTNTAVKETLKRTTIVAKFLCLLHVTDTYLFSSSIVHGVSMLPTLNERGDVVLLERLSHRIGKVGVGDIVFVKSPHNPNRILTKRVLGLEGDVVSYTSGSWHSTVDHSLVVPKGHVWIQGDNLLASYDSRHFGPLPYGLIQGKAFCRLKFLSEGHAAFVPINCKGAHENPEDKKAILGKWFGH